MRNPGTDREPRISDLYPELDGNELRRAEDNLDEYIKLILRIYERIRLDPEAHSRFKALTASKPERRIKDNMSDEHSALIQTKT
jgi:hypothetical protein